MPSEDDTAQHVWFHNSMLEWECKRCGWKMMSINKPDSKRKYVLMEMTDHGQVLLPGGSMDCGEYLAYRIMQS